MARESGGQFRMPEKGQCSVNAGQLDAPLSNGFTADDDEPSIWRDAFCYRFYGGDVAWAWQFSCRFSNTNA